jgi:protein-tyrosine phosphatase
MSELFVVTTVCTGNICRSPLAQVLLQRYLTEAGVHAVDVQSAGTHASHGQRVTVQMLSVGHDLGVDLADHRSQLLELTLVRGSDLLLCATAAQRDRLVSKWSFLGADQVALYQDAVPKAVGHDVPDPYGLVEGEYALAGALIERAMRAWAVRLAERITD